jgi:hypothetical protein
LDRQQTIELTLSFLCYIFSIMLRWLAIPIVIFALAQKPLPVQGENKQGNAQAKPADPQPLPPPITSEVDKENATNAERYAYYKAHPKEYLKAALAPANASNWVLAGLGFAASLIGVFTLLAIKRQSNLQAASLRQWVDVEVTGSETDDSLRDAFGELAKSGEVRVRFKAINETSLPLTIVKIVTRVSRTRVGGKLVWEVFETDEWAILPPSKPGKESSHPFFVFLGLDEGGVRAYVDHTMLISIRGVIYFRSAAGKIDKQSFGKVMNISGLFMRELPFRGIEPSKVEKKARRDNPNRQQPN